MDAMVEFKNVSEGIRIWYADERRVHDFELWKEWEGEQVFLKERIETKNINGGYKWSGEQYKWLAVNTGANRGTFELQWQGAAQLVAAAATLVALQF